MYLFGPVFLNPPKVSLQFVVVILAVSSGRGHQAMQIGASSALGCLLKRSRSLF